MCNRRHAAATLALLTALHAGCQLPLVGADGAADLFADRLRNPPAHSRIIKIIHSWPDDAAAQDGVIRSLSTQGFGGVVCNVSFTDYLESDAKWAAFTRAVSAAKAGGFSMWLYDEEGYPSASAGGLVLRGHPESEARGLLIADIEAVGGGQPVTLDIPPGAQFLAAAFRVVDESIELKQRVELSRYVENGKLSWQPGSGRWRVMVVTEDRLFDGTHAAMSLDDHIPYPNLLQREPTARFLELTHDRYATHLGKDLGKYFVATFTDEPSLMSLFLRPMPYRVLPWAPDLPAEFRKRRGYALEPVVPALIADAGAEGRRARYDYWRTVGELVSDNFFGQIQDWCAKHNVLSGGHLLMEENLVNHVPLYGDFFACLRRLDAPSIDCLTSIPEQVPWFIARLAASAAELEGKSVTMCETSDHGQRYRGPGDKRTVRDVTEEEIRGTCNRLVVGGIDTITSYYSFAKLSDEALRRLNAWVGRCCTALKGGHHVTDIAVLYPVDSLWPRFTPARHLANDSPAAMEIENVFRDVSDSLFTAGRDFEYVDARALAEAKVDQGVLVHGKMRWRCVILPGTDTLPKAAWDNLAKFVASGGFVVAVGALPANTEREFPAAQCRAIATTLFGNEPTPLRIQANKNGGGGVFLPAGATALLPSLLDRVLAPDVRVFGARNPVRSNHRRIDGHEVFFVINDGSLPWEGMVGFSATGTGERWNPATGEMVPVANSEQQPLTLEPYGAALFRFREARLPARKKLDGGTLGSPLLTDLRAVKPLVARGEFVREELVPRPGDVSGGRESWRVTGRIVKSQVDTFLFMRLPFEPALDLNNADCLVLNTHVPKGQRATAQLLVILHEKDGADYLATTGRMLGATGETQSWVPLSRFQLAGWSEDKNHRLDLANISEIRVGWGGYLGTEGEQVVFTLEAPQTAKLQN